MITGSNMTITSSSNTTTTGNAIALVEAFGEQEDLDPELEQYLEEIDGLGLSIRHPLVYSLIHFPILNARINAQLRYKKEALTLAEEEGNWHTYVYLHERAYRVNAFQAIMGSELTDAEYWDLLGDIWIDSENIRQNPRIWQELMSSERPERQEIMNDDEREELAAMDAVIPVYQGHTTRRHDGWSWTTDRSKAEWFAHRFASMEKGQPVVTAGRVKKEAVVAYFTRRNEFEIVAPRSRVRNREVTQLTQQKEPRNGND